MANSNQHSGRTFAIVLALAAGGFAAYYFHTHTKRYYATVIMKLGGASNFSGLMGMDEPYLAAWAKQLAKGLPTFVYKGKPYNTSGGSAVV
jgi:hypothetical protein